jgi:hypothetical protein
VEDLLRSEKSMNYYLTIGCVLRDETERNILEWIIYHRHLGVEHFYLCDNESRVPVISVIEKFGLGHACTVHRISGECRGYWPDKQAGIYDFFVRTYGQGCFWMALIDVDEFIFPIRGQTIPDVLRIFENAGGLAVRWTTFGSNGHLVHPEGKLQIEAYTKRVPDEVLGDKAEGNSVWVKTIIRPPFVRQCGPHQPRLYRSDKATVDERFGRVESDMHGLAQSRVRLITINHYFLRSRADYDAKVQRNRFGMADYLTNKEEFWRGVEDRATEEDRRILCHLRPVKRQVMACMAASGALSLDSAS